MSFWAERLELAGAPFKPPAAPCAVACHKVVRGLSRGSVAKTSTRMRFLLTLASGPPPRDNWGSANPTDQSVSAQQLTAEQPCGGELGKAQWMITQSVCHSHSAGCLVACGFSGAGGFSVGETVLVSALACWN